MMYLINFVSMGGPDPLPPFLSCGPDPIWGAVCEEVCYCGSAEYCCGEFTSGYTGNTNSDTEGWRILSDITKLIDRVYISKVDLQCEANGNVTSDVAGLLDLADINRLIDHVYESKAQTAACK